MFQSKVKSKFRILDFDIESRPLSYMGHDFTTSEITVIAWKFIGEDSPVECYALGECVPEFMLEMFLQAYNKAGMVTGHYIRGYDLPRINQALSEYGFPPLEDKLAHDTCLDLIKQQGFSKSQENLGELYGIENPKVGMSQHKWRQANRLKSIGIELAKERAIGDVIQHIELRQKLIDMKQLGKPKLWSSKTIGK